MIKDISEMSLKSQKQFVVDALLAAKKISRKQETFSQMTRAVELVLSWELLQKKLSGENEKELSRNISQCVTVCEPRSESSWHESEGVERAVSNWR